MQIRRFGPSIGPSPANPGVVTASFAECDQFAEALRHEGMEVVQTVRGRCANRVLLIPLANTLFRYGTHQSPWLCSATALAGHISVVMDTVSQGPTIQNGQSIYEESAFGLHGGGAEHVSQSSPGEYCYAPFPETQFREACLAATGFEVAVPEGGFRRVRPEGTRWLALLDTVAAIRRQAEDEPATWTNPRKQAALERSLLSAVVLAVAADVQRPAVAPTQSAGERSVIVRRAQEYLRAHSQESVYVLDLCAATGVSERTLRDAFLDRCGMGPMRYLNLRRLHNVRRALRTPPPGSASVKAIALDHGFWELGRFAQAYRNLFGERPSDTLRAALPRGDQSHL